MFPTLFAVRTNRSIDVYNENAPCRVSIFQTQILSAPGGGGSFGYRRQRRHEPRYGWDYDDGAAAAEPETIIQVSPYRIFRGPDEHAGHGDEEDTFLIQGRFGVPASEYENPPVTLCTEMPPDRDHDRSTHGSYYYDFEQARIGRERDRSRDPGPVVYRGPWRHAGLTVFSMYCGRPIPLLEFNHPADIDWPGPQFNRALAVPASGRVIVPVWARRWNPASWEAEIAEYYNARVGRLTPPPPAAAASGGAGGGSRRPAPAPAPAPAAAVVPLPSFVADLIIADAVAKGATCPITMEPLTKETARVTPCYHVFDATALAAWAASNEESPTPICPQCRSRI